VSDKALTTSAKVVVHRNQFRRRFEATEADFPEEEEEEETPEQERKKPDAHSFGEYLGIDAETQKGSQVHEETPEYLLSAESCIEASKNTLELLEQLPKDDPSIQDLLQKCSQLKTALSSFVSQTEQQELLSVMLQQIDLLDAVILHA